VNILDHDSFPRSSTYDPEWLIAQDMGPNPLWLLEDLLADIAIEPAARVLDLGCGLGATSVFLARELGVRVDAVDLWTPADDVRAVVTAGGADGLVEVTNADARALPFDDAIFDVVVCIDAWEYFGTDDRFLPQLLRVLKPSGTIGIATPAMHRDVRDLGEIPEHIDSAVGWEALAWHSPGRWREQWELSGLLDDVRARPAPTGWADWLRWSRLVAGDAADDDPVVRMLEADAGELLTFALVSGRTRA
jgi:SAM-dependent methyltransferase